ncbi:hypothetical protein TSUD_375560 [Trifolium subterraneum]|uniref:Retrotransposon gag domain-containing protein n=1 Tax=Trifolium subterraneum TaxID=3900 RepID=A0A2Z6PEF6_TRISU|nr:hypothetical protein TSUD_375560 [Trifolium subterraneum]
MRGQNELIREHNRRIQAVEDSRTASRISRSTYRRRSPTPENYSSRSRSRSPRPVPRKNEERPLSPVREHPRRNNRSPPRNNRSPPPRNNHSPPPRNIRSPTPRNGEVNHGHSSPTRTRKTSIAGQVRWRSLHPRSIDSWDELFRLFRAHFTTSKRHPKMVANLKAIVQGPEEPLRSYIERFNKEAVEVDATDKMKLYLLEDGLREGTKFQEAAGIVEMATLNEFFELVQRYIKWEEKQKASEVRRPKNQGEAGPSSNREDRRGEDKKRDGKVREAKPPKSQSTYYTPLNSLRDRILFEISSAEFKIAGIRFPKQLPAKPNVDKKKLCRFHKSYGHVTEDCVHLKDAIEILIHKGYAQQYVEGQPRTDNRVVGGVAFSVSRPEDFTPLPNNNEKEALNYLSVHLDGSWENFPGAIVIFGGGFNPVTIGSIKRKFDELENASPVGEINIPELKESSVPLAFYRE